jgi:hypothetical protein
LLKTHYESSIFVFSAFSSALARNTLWIHYFSFFSLLYFWKKIKPTCSNYILLATIHADCCQK